MRSSQAVGLARKLRRNSTEAEKALWKQPHAKRLEGNKFRRQQPIGDYIVDFVCFEKNIIIEIDGGQHAAQTHEDSRRDEILAQQGFKVLRFWNNEVLGSIEGVLEKVKSNL